MHQQVLTAVHLRSLAALQRQLQLSKDSARCVRVTGEPWSGKTLLLQQLAEYAGRSGWTVAWGRAPRTGRSAPFEVLVDALDEHLARADGSLFEQLGPSHTRALAPHFPSLTGTRRSAQDGAPQEAISALRALVQLLAQRCGLLLLLDDVHRASAEALDFLEHLVRHPPDPPVLTVFAHRTSPTGRHLSEIGYSAEGVLHHVALEPLDDADARGMLPSRLTPLQQELALRDGAGVPGLLRALACGVTASAGCDRLLYAQQDLLIGVPPAFPGQEAVELHTLSSLGWRTACAAAVVGDPFTADVVAATAPLPLDDVLRGLDELHSECLVQPAFRSPRFTFVHPAVRALVHHASGAGWRAAARLRAVQALRQEAAPASATALAALLADAPELGPDDTRTLVRAAREGLFTRPWSTVRALRRVTADAPGPLEAVLLLHKALVLAGCPEAAEHEYRTLRPRLRTAHTAAVGAEALVWQARAMRLAGRPAQALALLRSLPGAGPPVAEAETERAALALESGAADAAAAARRAVGAAGANPAGGSCGARGHALALLAAACVAAGDGPGAREAAAESARLLGALPEAVLAVRVEALRWLGEAEHALGQVELAERHFARGFALALGHGQDLLLGHQALGLARVHLAAGDLDLAGTRAALAAETAGRYGGLQLAGAARELCSHIEAAATHAARGHAIDRLSGRELEIAKLVSTGCTNRDIAARLEISAKTVDTYMSRIFKKLSVNSRAQVAHAVGSNPAH